MRIQHVCHWTPRYHHSFFTYKWMQKWHFCVLHMSLLWMICFMLFAKILAKWNNISPRFPWNSREFHRISLPNRYLLGAHRSNGFQPSRYTSKVEPTDVIGTQHGGFTRPWVPFSCGKFQKKSEMNRKAGKYKEANLFWLDRLVAIV